MRGARLLKKTSPLVSQVVGAFVTTVALSLGFMLFNDFIAPPPDLSGNWKFTVTYENTTLSSFKDLGVTYQVLLIQEGLKLSGSGEKVSEGGTTQDIEHYTGESRRTHIDIVGSIVRNYFSCNVVVLHYKEENEDSRQSSTVHRLVQCSREAMDGRFSSTIADSSGPVWWQRRDGEDQVFDPVKRPAAGGAGLNDIPEG